MSIELELMQYESEIKYSKRNITKVIKESIDKTDTNVVMVTLLNKVNEYLHGEWWDSKSDYVTAILMTDISALDIVEHLLLSTVKHQTTVVNNIASSIGNLFSEYIDDVFTRVQIGADILISCEDIIYELNKVGDNIMFKSWIDLDSNERLLVSKFIYQPPLLANRLRVSNNYTSPYYTFNESIILGNNHCNHNKLVGLDVVNIQNKINFELDNDVIKTRHEAKAELEGDALKNWKQYVIEQEMLESEYKEKSFGYSHQYDSRGRLYVKAYHISYQGNEYCKGAINFSRKEVVSLT